MGAPVENSPWAPGVMLERVASAAMPLPPLLRRVLTLIPVALRTRWAVPAKCGRSGTGLNGPGQRAFGGAGAGERNRYFYQ